MSFMQPVVEKGKYYSVNANHGETYIVPEDVAGTVKTWGELADYVEGKIDEPDEPAELSDGWLYRMSAPGYMDATDWGACETEAEAWAELLEYHGTSDDGEREDWEEEACRKAGVCYQCGNNVPKDADHDGHCSKKCRVQHMEQTGPEDDDYTTEDYQTFYQYGKAVVSTDSENWQRDVKTHMDAAEFWPNVWYQGERGDYNLLDITTGRYASES